METQKKVLFVANVSKEHINKFHLPSIMCFKQNGWTVDVACHVDEEVPYCEHCLLGKWERSPFTFKTIVGILQLKQYLKENKYDVIYCHTPVGGLVARVAAISARRKGTKVVYFAHGLHFYDGAPLINWLFFYPIEKMLSKITDAIFLINQEDYIRVKQKFYTKTIKKFPGIGVDFQRLTLKDPVATRKKYRENYNIAQDELVLIYVAELIPNKNQKMLLECLQIILNNNVKSKLMLVGPDHCKGLVQKMAKEMGIEDFVIFTGWRNDIAELMATADICVASSIREGFGLNLIEAMYCGLPVVASKNRGHETIISDCKNGYLVNTSEEMARRVLELIENQELMDKMSHVDVSMYDANYVAEQIVQNITAICAEKEVLRK